MFISAFSLCSFPLIYFLLLQFKSTHQQRSAMPIITYFMPPRRSPNHFPDSFLIRKPLNKYDTNWFWLHCCTLWSNFLVDRGQESFLRESPPPIDFLNWPIAFSELPQLHIIDNRQFHQLYNKIKLDDSYPLKVSRTFHLIMNSF